MFPQAFQHLGEVDVPKFTVVVAQKNHHTKLFQAGAPENVPPGLFPYNVLSVVCFCFDFIHNVLKHAAPAYVHFHSLSAQVLWSIQRLCIPEIMTFTCVLRLG